MDRSVTATTGIQNPSTSLEGERDTAASAMDAEVQTHHRWLLCLEQSRRAQHKMVHDWMRDAMGTARTLATRADQGQWMQGSAALGWALIASSLHAQSTTLAAWSEFQRSVLDQARANADVGHASDWSLSATRSIDAESEGEDGPTPRWLTEAIRTYEKLAEAWTSAWVPGGATAQTPS